MPARLVPRAQGQSPIVVGCLALLAVVGVVAAFGPDGRVATAAAARRAGVLDEPRHSVAEHVLLWEDDFEVAPVPIGRGRVGRYVTLDARRPEYERDGGVGGGGALRFAWTGADSVGADCADDSQLIEASFPAAGSVVISYWLRFSPGFVFDWRGRTRCHGNAKKLFLLWARDGSRFVFISENGVLGVGSDHDHPLFAQNAGAAMSPAALADGAWHRITLRVRQGTTATAADGAVYGWIDGVLRWRVEGIVTHNAGGYHLFKMPATFNSGSPVTQTEWMDGLRIWRDR